MPPFLPEGFEPPVLLETPRFKLRPISTADTEKDFDAVMSSREHLWSMFGEAWGWPAEDLTLEQDRRDLEWHENEFATRSSFDYAVMSPDESRLLGCVYVDPPEKEGTDADIHLWVRDSDRAVLDAELYATVRRWIADEWPFGRVTYPGRETSWADWHALPDRATTD